MTGFCSKGTYTLKTSDGEGHLSNADGRAYRGRLTTATICHTLSDLHPLWVNNIHT